MGVPGSVAFGFTQQGILLVPASGASEDEVMEIALGCDAEDVSGDGDMIQVVTKPADLERVRAALEAKGLAIENAEITFTPQTTVALDADAAAKLLVLLEAIEDHDDVQKVHHNAELPD